MASARSISSALATLAPVLLLSASPLLSAESSDGLYRVVSIVTGERDDTRGPALRQDVVDVLIKVSGDPSLANDARIRPLADQAEDYVEHYSYRDRLAGKPIHDEQGTRDRPHDLTVDFQPSKVDAALRRLGRQPWAGPRPRIAIFLAVRQGGATYMSSQDGERSYGQPDAFRAAAAKSGLPVVLPSEAELSAQGIDAATLESASTDRLLSAAKAVGADLPLAGAMTFRAENLGWTVTWRLLEAGRETRWQVKGVSYDEAFRNALRGAAQRLSGHGRPSG